MSYTVTFVCYDVSVSLKLIIVAEINVFISYKEMIILNNETSGVPLIIHG